MLGDCVSLGLSVREGDCVCERVSDTLGDSVRVGLWLIELDCERDWVAVKDWLRLCVGVAETLGVNVAEVLCVPLVVEESDCVPVGLQTVFCAVTRTAP